MSHDGSSLISSNELKDAAPKQLNTSYVFLGWKITSLTFYKKFINRQRFVSDQNAIASMAVAGNIWQSPPESSFGL